MWSMGMKIADIYMIEHKAENIYSFRLGITLQC